MKGVDEVPRGVILLHKGNQLERPLQAVCRLEIKSVVQGVVQETTEEVTEPVRSKRKAAVDAQAKIRELAKNDAI